MNPTRSRHGEARCAELIGIARDLLVEGGLDTFAMRTVAARAGMRLGNLQYYYATRDDLLEEVIRTEFERDLNTVRDTVTADPPKTMSSPSSRTVSWMTGAPQVALRS